MYLYYKEKLLYSQVKFKIITKIFVFSDYYELLYKTLWFNMVLEFYNILSNNAK